MYIDRSLARVQTPRSRSGGRGLTEEPLVPGARGRDDANPGKHARRSSAHRSRTPSGVAAQGAPPSPGHWHGTTSILAFKSGERACFGRHGAAPEHPESRSPALSAWPHMTLACLGEGGGLRTIGSCSRGWSISKAPCGRRRTPAPAPGRRGLRRRLGSTRPLGGVPAQRRDARPARRLPAPRRDRLLQRQSRHAARDRPGAPARHPGRGRRPRSSAALRRPARSRSSCSSGPVS